MEERGKINGDKRERERERERESLWEGKGRLIAIVMGIGDR